MVFITIPTSILAYATQNLCCLVPMVVFFSGWAIFFGGMVGSIAKEELHPTTLSRIENEISTFTIGPLSGGVLPSLVALWMWVWSGGGDAYPEWGEAAGFYWDLTLFCVVVSLFSIIYARMSP